MDEHLSFEECESCRARPGSPRLCDGCRHNRRVISALSRRLERLRLGPARRAMLRLGALLQIAGEHMLEWAVR